MGVGKPRIPHHMFHSKAKHMRSIRAVVIILFLAWIAPGFGKALAADKPLNILVLYADDWRHDTLGVAGNPVVSCVHELPALVER